MMNRCLENVPEHRRAIVEERLNKLISRSCQEGEKEERKSSLSASAGESPTLPSPIGW